MSKLVSENLPDLLSATSALVQTPLPYAETALEPVISAKTMALHYGKHHKGYVDNLNKLISGTDYSDMSLEEIVHGTAGRPERMAIFNNAAQAWNHTFFWNCLKAQGGGQPAAELLKKINASFGSLDTFKKDFARVAVAHFGSGWAWLVMDGDTLKVVSTANADNPLAAGLKPLLVIDVWEHSYYLDYQNRRVDYANDVIEKLINWDFALQNMKAV